MERPELHPDEAGHLATERLHQPLPLAVLSPLGADAGPGVVPPGALEIGGDPAAAPPAPGGAEGPVVAGAGALGGDPFAVEGDAALRDQRLGVAPRADPGTCDDLGDAFARGTAIVGQGAARAMDDEGWIAQALAEAEAAAARGEVPVGAVLVSEAGELLAADGNRIVERRDPTAHAEMLAIRAGAERLANERLVGT